MSLIAEVLMHSGLFAIFLISFFYTFVSYVQIVALNRDIKDILNSYLEDSFLKTTRTQRMQLTQAFDNSITSNQQKINAYQSDLDVKNKKILTYSLLAFIFYGVISISLAILIVVYTGGNVVEFIIQNLITLFFIMVSEFIIVGLFMNSFIILDRAFVKATLVKSQNGSRQRCEYVDDWLKSNNLTSIINTINGNK